MEEKKPQENQPESKPAAEQQPQIPQKTQQTQITKKPFMSSRMHAEKRKELFKKFVSIFVFIIMVGSSVIIGWDILGKETEQNTSTISVQGYNFYLQDDGTFFTYLNMGTSKVPIAFRLDPRNASLINLDASAVQQILTAKKLYLTFNPLIEDKAKVAVAVAEIARITGLYNIETVGSYLNDSDPPDPGIPIRTCEDVSSTTTVLELGINSNAAVTSITNEKGCIKISAKNADELISAADKLGMNLIGIKL